MDSRAMEIANLLLAEGSLRRGDPEHDQVYTELMGDDPLFSGVRDRLAGVGYDLVQELGHLGVRMSRPAEQVSPLRNRMGLHAGHIRLIVYLWVHLVYREWVNLRRDLETAAPGAEQESMFEDEEPPWISYRAVMNELSEHISKSYLKGVLRGLQNHRFIRLDEKRDRIWADASLYILVDRNRMEDFVVGLARRMGTDDPVAAVSEIAAGSRPLAGDGREG